MSHFLITDLIYLQSRKRHFYVKTHVLCDHIKITSLHHLASHLYLYGHKEAYGVSVL